MGHGRGSQPQQRPPPRCEPGRAARAKKIELIRGDTVATGPSERCQQFNRMHLAEFLSGPNKRRDRGRLTDKKRDAHDGGSLRLLLYSHFSVDSAFSLLPGPTKSPRGPAVGPSGHDRRADRRKLLSIPRMYSVRSLPLRSRWPASLSPHLRRGRTTDSSSNKVRQPRG